MNDPDNLSYLRFTGPGQRDKAVYTLSGILNGMWTDGHFNPREVKELKDWCAENSRLIQRAPFNEIIPKLLTHLSDDTLDQNEYEDIKWVVQNSQLGSEYYDCITTDIQELHGMLHGITSDGKIDISELSGLRRWITSRDHLKGLYPYDEIESLIISTLRDGRIDEAEHSALMAFFGEFVSYSLNKRVSNAIAASRGEISPMLSRTGICAIDPEILFQDRVFVFTGVSEKAGRAEMAQRVRARGGEFSESVPSSHYLVVGNMGNPAWAFACYGRKVEKAMQLRKEGRKITIANEVDFWDALVS